MEEILLWIMSGCLLIAGILTLKVALQKEENKHV